MKRARRLAGGVKRSVARLLARQSQEWPDLHQMSLLAQLTAPTGELEDAAVTYFSKALSIAGFFSGEESPRVVAEYMKHKNAWCQALLAEVEQQRRVGLSVYAALTEPLEGGLDWSKLPTDKYKDRLYQLRPHRFGFAPRLAIAASCGADALPALLATLERWIALVDARETGDAYFSNLVIIYRILAISWTVPFCVHLACEGDKTAATICLRLFQILAADVRYLWPRLGDSAANNHLLADRFAAWFLVACYPDLCPKADTAELERVWQNELCRQFYADGTNFEQSVHYHELGCELTLAYLVISLRSGNQIPTTVVDRIGKMYRFQAVLADGSGNSFSLGDATDDPLLPLDSGTGPAGGAWRMVYRSLFDASFPATSDRARGAERAYWPLAALSDVEKPMPAFEPPPLGSFAPFPDGGYVVMFEDKQEQRILFRTGPRPGIPVHFGHAMSDLLSVYWTVEGQPVMEPSGTFSYALPEGQARNPMLPRTYFRSPASSNGIVLQGHDPLGAPTGRFRTRDNGTRVRQHCRSLEKVMSWSEGQLDEEGPLKGHRRGVLHLFEHYILVYDHIPRLPPAAAISCHWQLAPEVRTSVSDGKLTSMSFADATAFICVDGDRATMECARGQKDPMAGWVSRSYGKMEDASQLIANLRPASQTFASVFGLHAGSEHTWSVNIRHVGDTGMLLDIEHHHHRGIVCIGSLSLGQNVLPFDLDFRGDALWLDIESDALREIRALGLLRLRSDSLDLDLAPGAGTPEKWRLLAHQSEGVAKSGRWKFMGTT